MTGEPAQNAPSVAADRPLFSSRYGLVKDPWGREHWTARHADHGVVQFGCCPPDWRRACACPGSAARRGCCEVATAEDLLCDACREHCWAITPDKVHVRLIDAWGPVLRAPTDEETTDG